MRIEYDYNKVKEMAEAQGFKFDESGDLCLNVVEYNITTFIAYQNEGNKVLVQYSGDEKDFPEVAELKERAKNIIVITLKDKD